MSLSLLSLLKLRAWMMLQPLMKLLLNVDCFIILLRLGCLTLPVDGLWLPRGEHVESIFSIEPLPWPISHEIGEYLGKLSLVSQFLPQLPQLQLIICKIYPTASSKKIFLHSQRQHQCHSQPSPLSQQVLSCSLPYLLRE